MRHVPPFVLIPPLGCTPEIWDEIATLVSSCRTVIRCDLPGHGARRGQAGYPRTLAALIQDALHQAAGKMAHEQVFDVGGLSIGGLVALGLAQTFPAKVRRLVLANSALHLPASAHAAWRARAARACQTGMDSIVNGTLARCFADGFRSRQAGVCEAVARQLRACDPAAYAALTEILVTSDLRPHLASLNQPTLVVTAPGDDVVPAGTDADLMAGLPHALHWPLAGTHFAPIEHAALFACRVAAFLDAPMDTAEGTT